MKKSRWELFNLTFMAMMAAMVYVVTLFRFPLLGSKVHLANAVCLLAGLLMGPVQGGLAAGLGSALYDALAGGYDLAGVLITFVSKFAMAWVCGRVAGAATAQKQTPPARSVCASAAGALTYVMLYMLKTYVYQRFVYGFPLDATWATMVSKLIPSLINALAAVVATPIVYHALVPALRAGGLLERLRGAEGSD